MTREGSGTWHHGLIARYWNEFNTADPDELAYYLGAVKRFGEPALDVGCGTGRLLLPIAEAGVDVDGTDISADMLALCANRATSRGLRPRLLAQATHELDPERSYRTAYMSGVFGIGGSRSNDLEALRRINHAMEPGGMLLIDHELPYSTDDEKAWARWLPGHRADLPTQPSVDNERRRAANGDEFELFGRLLEFDPLAQRRTMELGARLWRDGHVVEEEAPRPLQENLYFAQEIILQLQVAGFVGIRLEHAFSGEPAGPEDGEVIFVGRKPD